MSNEEFQKYKDSQRKTWDSAADGWQKWWETIEKGAQKLSDRLVNIANIKQGSRVLDIATGVGEPAITAAKRIGNNGGHVLAIDISPQMISIAKQRARSLGLQDLIEFREGDIETIDLPESNFDAALCRFGLMFLPSLRTALSNICKSLKEGGYFATAVWASPEKVPFISLVLDVVVKEINKPPFPINMPGPFSLSNQNLIQGILLEAGFRDVSIGEIDVTFTFDSPENYIRFIQTTTPINAILSNEKEEKKQQIWKIVDEIVRNYATTNSGSLSLDNEAIYLVCRK